jgi:signal transduction histidine kinase
MLDAAHPQAQSKQSQVWVRRARAMEVQIDYLKGEFKISVRDDGRGIDAKVVKNGREGHWGLSGMREREAAIHGRLRILSKVDAGTEVEIVVPRIYASAR